jgi:AcrR family transcriptional regulator
MSNRSTPRISMRKSPKQARSRQLVAEILTAAGRVLARYGAHCFTAARVAEEAGVSVGSLYQYFPNKQAILFRLQADEWKQTGVLLAGLLADTSVRPLDRLRTAVREFVRSECEEVKMRVALGDVEILYRDAPEARALRVASARTARAFMREVLPHVTERERTVAADIILMSMTAVGKQVSEAAYSAIGVKARARALGDMLCTYTQSLRKRETREVLEKAQRRSRGSRRRSRNPHAIKS